MSQNQKQITSWALNRADRILKATGETLEETLEGTCTTCLNAQWKARITNEKGIDNKKAREHEEAYFIGKLEQDKRLVLTCFCTVSHEYIVIPYDACDGNPPQEEPQL